ncbi:hypothetical protein ACFY2R_01180 [Micromonospora olivasterospora]|uniref:Uncharacterized protein n=1 Tax=Micromonospora olivasterospora TaxID=1880 RepID=A0A562ICR9_MICOL|nr:hypothetical protein [Micromonospora olivasterospora]TWH68712.1 hypothetical protein JD77_03710 [Micromonospora olivasterospora]
MRFARALAGMLLLTIGIPALLAGGALGLAAGDGAGGVAARLGALDLRVRPDADWLPVAAWTLVGLGALLVAAAVLLLLRPVRPREVVFVVEPDQVPVLADRLGVASLSGLGARPEPAPALAAEPQLAEVGAPAVRPRPALGPAPARRPATLADLAAAPARTPPAWPPLTPEKTVPPVRIETRRIRPAAPGGVRARQRS